MDHYTNMDNLINRLKKKIETKEIDETTELDETTDLENTRKNIYYSTSANSIKSVFELVALIIFISINICIFIMFYWLIIWFW